MSKNLLSLLLIVSTFAVYYLLIGPLYKGTGGVWQPETSVQSLMTLNKQYDDTLAQADAIYSQAETLRGQYARISNDQKDTMKVMVPDSIDKVRLLSEVSGIFNQLGFTTNDLSYAEGVTTPNGRGTVAISFSVKTNYSRFKELMDNFEKSMRLFSIQSVSFNAPEKDGDITTYQVKLETYFIK